jgi:ankyrin repeat protein
LFIDLPTPLFSACKYDNKDVVDFLLKRNCKVDEADSIGQIALHAACENGNIDKKCTTLINVNIMFYQNLNNVFITPFTGFMNSTMNVTIIVQQNLYNICNRNYLEFETFTEGHKDILTLLIDKQCDVNISDNNSQTPLHIACYKGNVALVEILLRNK